MLEQITVQENGPTLGTQVNWGYGIRPVGLQSVILDLWGISQIFSVCSGWNLQPVNTSFICILSARNCAKYIHSIQIACSMYALHFLLPYANVDSKLTQTCT